MYSFKTIFLITLLVAFIACIYAQVPPGLNAYLPPKKNGYDYPEPNKPFKPPPGSRPGPPGPRPGPPGPKPPPGPRPGPRPGGNPPPGQPGHVHMSGNPFDFEYAVQDQATNNDYAHKASSNGDVVKGEYRVQLPDGRTQIVRYTADWATGYHAEVSYEGEPQYPQGPSGRPGQGGRPGSGYRY